VDGNERIKKTIVSFQSLEHLSATFFGKEVRAMDREELKGLVCWMLDNPELLVLARNIQREDERTDQ
jgi:ABC-type iron transport system FetAB ATPase subunit